MLNPIEGRRITVTTKLGDAHSRRKKVAILGLSFKLNTDDIRATRSISIINQMLRKAQSSSHMIDPVTQLIFSKMQIT